MPTFHRLGDSSAWPALSSCPPSTSVHVQREFTSTATQHNSGALDAAGRRVLRAAGYGTPPAHARCRAPGPRNPQRASCTRLHRSLLPHQVGLPTLRCCYACKHLHHSRRRLAATPSSSRCAGTDAPGPPDMRCRCPQLSGCGSVGRSLLGGGCCVLKQTQVSLRTDNRTSLRTSPPLRNGRWGATKCQMA
jgi:hypothetical protein